MKKILLIILILFVINIKEDSQIIIPEDAIRFRIIANSNTQEDQLSKFEIASDITNNIFSKYSNTTIKQEYSEQIINSIPEIDSLLNKYDVHYNIKYGNNYFPAKNYNGIEYNSGEYESLVITLGQGKGDNFWCVLFPPLCLLESKNNNTDEIEYRSLVKDILDRF